MGVNVYDFDNTIYDGESIADFFLFCLGKKKSLIKYLPLMAYTLICYKLRLLSVKKMLSIANKMTSAFVNVKDNFDELIDEFWKLNEHKLKPQFLSRLKSDDIIITAALNFLIDRISYKFKTKNIICSIFNVEKGKFEFLCFRENKVKILKEKYPNVKIENFYSDSLNDIPLMKLSKRSYLVNEDKEKLINPKVYMGKE